MGATGSKNKQEKKAEDTEMKLGMLTKLADMFTDNLVSNGMRVRDELRGTLLRLSNELDGVIAFIQDTIRFIEKISEHDPNNIDIERDQHLKSFAQELRKTIQVIKDLIVAATTPNISNKELIDKTNELLKQVPPMLEAIECLDLGELSDGMPTSVSKLGEKISLYVTNIIEETLPIYMRSALKDISSAMLTTDADSIETFKSLSPIKQNGILVALHGFHHYARSFVLLVDRLEAKYALNTGSLLNDEEIGSLLKRMPLLTGLRIEVRSLAGFLNQVSQAYKLRMENARNPYELKEEIYPFERAKLIDRLKQLEANSKRLQSLRQVDGNKHVVVWEMSKNPINTLIERAFAVIDAENISANKKQGKKDFLNGLKAKLAENDKRDDAGERSRRVSRRYNKRAIEKLDSFVAPHLNEKFYKENFKELVKHIREMLEKSEKRYQVRISKRENHIARLNTRIAEIRSGGIDVTEAEVENDVNPYSADNDELKEAGLNELSEAYQDLVEFMAEVTLHDPKAEKKTSGLELMRERLTTIKEFIKKRLDQSVYQQYFEQNNELDQDSEYVLSWVGELGRSIQTVERAIAQLTELKAEFTQVEARDQQHSQSPQADLVRQLKLAGGFRTTVKTLGLSLNNLAANPFMAECAEELSSMRNMLKIRQAIVDHPLTQLAVTKGVDLAKKALNPQRIDLFIQELESFYKHAADKYQPDDMTRSTALVCIDKLRKLNKNFQDEKFTDDSKRRKYLAYTLKNLRSIIYLLPKAGQMHASLVNLGKREAVQLIEQLNQFIKALYLFADQLEQLFYLQDGHLLKSLLTIGDKSLDEHILELYEELETSGYRFASVDRPPYIQAIYAQRTSHAAQLEVTQQQCNDQLQALYVKRASSMNALEISAKQAEQEIADAHNRIVDKMGVLEVQGQAAVAEITRTLDMHGDNLANNQQACYAILELKTELQITVMPNVKNELHRLRDDKKKLEQQIEEAGETEEFTRKLVALNDRITVVSGIYANFQQAVDRIPRGIIFTSKPDGYQTAPIISTIITHCNAASAEIDRQRDLIHEKTSLAECCVVISGLRRFGNVDPSTLDLVSRRLRGKWMLALYKHSADYQQNEFLIKKCCLARADATESLNLARKRLQAVATQLPAADAVVDSSVREAVTMDINLRIRSLKRQRKSKFMSASKRRNLENSIFAYKEINAAYQTQGYTLDDARQDTRTLYATPYKALCANQRQHLIRLAAKDKTMTDDQRGHILVEKFVKPVPKRPDITLKSLKVRLDKRISDLDKQAASILYLGKVKAIKVDLLTELKDQLLGNKAKKIEAKSFAEAVKEVRSKHESNFHWLYDGETGKLMNTLELSTLSKQAMLQKIDIEIASLSARKEKTLCLPFFRDYRTKVRNNDLDKRIEALQILSDNDMDITKLTFAQQAMLRNHEKSLMADISQWHELNQAKVAQNRM